MVLLVGRDTCETMRTFLLKYHKWHLWVEKGNAKDGFHRKRECKGGALNGERGVLMSLVDFKKGRNCYVAYPCHLFFYFHKGHRRRLQMGGNDRGIKVVKGHLE